jgi:hypothetical protein
MKDEILFIIGLSILSFTFVPLKNGKAGSPEHKPEDGAS